MTGSLRCGSQLASECAPLLLICLFVTYLFHGGYRPCKHLLTAQQTTNLSQYVLYVQFVSPELFPDDARDGTAVPARDPLPNKFVSLCT